MDVFYSIILGGDIIFSTFYNIMFLTYEEFGQLISMSRAFTFDSIVFQESINIGITLPFLTELSSIIGGFFNAITSLFKPLGIFYGSDSLFGFTYMKEVPFYLCFISFFVNGLIVLGIIKLVAFVIELIPLE